MIVEKRNDWSFNNMISAKWLEKLFGKSRFIEIREFFKHFIIDEYKVKVVVTRRAYILFKLFLELFEKDADMKDADMPNVKLNGIVLNSHSLSFIEKIDILENDRILIFDDIIINGRNVSKIYSRIEKILNTKFTKKINRDGENICVWCLDLNENASCLDNIFPKTYWQVNEATWKRESNHLTNTIAKWNEGYVSILNTYELKYIVNDVINKIKEKVPNIKNIYSCNKPLFLYGESCIEEINANVIYLDKPENISYDIKPCIRIYPRENDASLIIPYVFLPKMEIDKVEEICKGILSSYNITVKEACFNGVFDNNKSILFYKWTIFKVSEHLANMLSQAGFELKPLFQCNESFPYEYINESFEDIKVKEETEYTEQDIKECIDILKKELESRKGNDINSDSRALSSYLAIMRNKDEQNAKKREKRHIGVSLSNEFFDDEELLTAAICSWESGEASSVIDIYENKDGHIEIAEFIRHGEQAFRIPYQLYIKEFCCTARYIMIKGNADNQSIKNFAEYMAKNVSSTDDVNFEKFIDDLFGKFSISPQRIKSDILSMFDELIANDFVEKKLLTLVDNYAVN